MNVQDFYCHGFNVVALHVPTCVFLLKNIHGSIGGGMGGLQVCDSFVYEVG